MSDEILRNGVPHNVTTSLVTRNAVLPQNNVIKNEVPALRDSGMGDSAHTSENMRETSSKFPQSSHDPEQKSALSYPTSKDTLHTHGSLSSAKSHIRDNIQALKNLAQSDNWQNIAIDKLNSNTQAIKSTTNISDNRQSVHEKSAADNFQSIGDTRSIQETKLYLAKKSIKTNRQLISQTTTERTAPNLAPDAAVKPSNLSSDALQTQTAKAQASDNSSNNTLATHHDNEFQIRVKKLKGDVRNVDNTLQNLDPDK